VGGGGGGYGKKARTERDRFLAKKLELGGKEVEGKKRKKDKGTWGLCCG
jgi:hypothetical protein